MPVTAMPQIEKALKGIPFPASKVQIVVYAGQHGADEDAMERLQALPVRQYDNMEEIGETLEESIFPDNQ